jgi:hypothetical protein
VDNDLLQHVGLIQIHSGANDVQEQVIHLTDVANPHTNAIQQSPTSMDSADIPVFGESNNTEPSTPQSPKSPSIDASEGPNIDTPGAPQSTLP